MALQISAKSRWRLKKKLKTSNLNENAGPDHAQNSCATENKKDKAVFETSSVISGQILDTNPNWDLSSISEDNVDDYDQHYNLTDYESSSEDDDDDTEYAHFCDVGNIPGTSNITGIESVHLLKSLAIKHNLTSQATEDILKLLKLHLPPHTNYPNSMHMLKKTLKLHDNWIEKNFYCDRCQVNLIALCCPKCKTEMIESKLVASGKFYVLLDVRRQVECLLKDPLINRCLSKSLKRRESLNETIQDISDGQKYKHLKLARHDLTCVFNSDGIPIFNSSHFSIWPILFSINELPFKVRRKSVMLAALWFGFKKPNFSLFLPQVLKGFNNMSINPIPWINIDNGEKIMSHIFFPICSVDLVARCMLQGITQFNGKFGCSFCLNEGKIVKAGRGHKRVYLPNCDAALRTDEAFRCQIRSNNFSYGVQFPSKLLDLVAFDIVHGFATDSMHCVYLGIMRSFANAWFSSTQTPYYIGNQTEAVDKMLLSVKVPSELSRCHRSITSRKMWKAAEWYLFLLDFPICLKDVLTRRYIKHFAYFAQAIFILNSVSISNDDLVEAEHLIQKFTTEIEILYGIEFYSANVHQLQHIVQCVRNWGPLWSTSTFQFENENGKLKTYIKSFKGAATQVTNKYSAEIQLKCIADKIFHNPTAQDFFSNVLNFDASLAPKYEIVSKKEISITESVKEQILALHLVSGIKRLYRGKSAYICYQLYRCADSHKQCNSIIKISPLQFGKITAFYSLTCLCECDCNCVCDYMLLDVFPVHVSKHPQNIFRRVKHQNTVKTIISIKQIVCASKFLQLELQNSIYYIELPNPFDVM